MLETQALEKKYRNEKFLLKSRLKKILGIVEGKFVCTKDSGFLRDQISELESPFPSHHSGIRELTRKMIQQAKFFRDNGNYGYLIKEKFYNLNGVQELASDILDEGKEFLAPHNNKFLYNVMIKEPGETLSVKQIRYVEGLKKRLDEIIIPHIEDNKFNPNVYGHDESMINDAKRLLTFAIRGKMKGGYYSTDYLEKIKNQWYTEDTGLNSLKNSLADYIVKNKLSVPIRRYEPIIKDLEVSLTNKIKKE